MEHGSDPQEISNFRAFLLAKLFYFSKVGYCMQILQPTQSICIMTDGEAKEPVRVVVRLRPEERPLGVSKDVINMPTFMNTRRLPSYVQVSTSAR
jgi:hypothetical protein